MPRLVKYSDSYFYNAIQKAPISDTSRRSYTDRLHVLCIVCHPKTILEILQTPDATLDCLKNPQESNAGTRTYGPYASSTIFAFLTAVKALLRHAGTITKTKLPDAARQRWEELFDSYMDAGEQRYLDNEPSQRQKDAYVTWNQVVARREQLKDDPTCHMEHLFLAMSSMIKPLRADFGHVLLYVNFTPSEADIKRQPNYILLTADADGSGDFTEGTLVLNEFKSSKNGTRTLRVTLPPELLAVIRRSLTLMPRHYLLVSRSDGEPWSNPQSYINWANRLLERIFRKKVTISLLRHSYISSLDFNTLSEREKKDIAEQMGHSVRMQSRYRLLFRGAQQAGARLEDAATAEIAPGS